jgi:multidrug resistance efflux pump
VTDHPNVDDYRNRAERAEAECAELRAKVEELEARVEGLLGDTRDGDPY